MIYYEMKSIFEFAWWLCIHRVPTHDNSGEADASYQGCGCPDALEPVRSVAQPSAPQTGVFSVFRMTLWYMFNLVLGQFRINICASYRLFTFTINNNFNLWLKSGAKCSPLNMCFKSACMLIMSDEKCTIIYLQNKYM